MNTDDEPSQRGCIISLEGVIGSRDLGDAVDIRSRLRQEGVDVSLYSVITSEELQYALVDALVPLGRLRKYTGYLISRWKKVLDRNIVPDLAKGKIILCDNYDLLPVTFAGKRSLDLKVPDLTVCFDLEPSKAMENAFSDCIRNSELEENFMLYGRTFRMMYEGMDERNERPMVLVNVGSEDNLVDHVSRIIYQFVSP